MLATLLLSQGTPMMLAGDEFGRTQQGNNNAYCQDSEISWLDWSIEDKGLGLIRFVQKLTKLRHKYPILRRNRFLIGDYNEELDVKDVTWINANGAEMQDEDWGETNMQCFGMLLDGRSQSTGIGQDATMLLVMNAHSDVVGFTLPECADGKGWDLLIDTNISDTDGGNFAIGEKYGATARSLLLFELRTDSAD
jgi:isoamylase